MGLDKIQDLVRAGKFRISAHALTESSKDGVRAEDIEFVILNGEIIEEYPDRQRVLILARLSESNLAVHVVCDHADPGEIVAITVYVPSRDEWIADRTRKNKHQK